MAQIPMVTAVRFDEHGDVTHVLMGVAESNTNQWVKEPVETPVIELVDKIIASDTVVTRMPDGTSGPGLRVAMANIGGGVETIVTDDLDRPIDDFLQF